MKRFEALGLNPTPVKVELSFRQAELLCQLLARQWHDKMLTFDNHGQEFDDEDVEGLQTLLHKSMSI